MTVHLNIDSRLTQDTTIEILELTRSYESRVYKQIQHIAMSTNANVDMQVLIVTQKPRDMRDQLDRLDYEFS